MLLAAFISASSILNLYTRLPSNEEVGFNNTQWVQIGFALLVTYRHTVAASKPDQTSAFRDTLSKLRSRVGALTTPDVDINGARDAFFDFGKRVAQIENWLAGDGRQEDNSHNNESFEDFQNTVCLEPMHFGGFMGAVEAEHLDIPFGNSFSASAEDFQVPQDFFFASSFEQITGEWV